MDFFTFVSKAIESLAWPAVILFVSNRYKLTLTGLLKSLTSLKVGEHFNATFSVRADEVAKASEEELPQEMSDEQVTLEERLLNLPPRLAILDAWKMVDNAIIDTINRDNLMPEITMKEEIIRRSPQKGSRLLKHHGYLNLNQLKLIDKLRVMRNQIVHGELGIEPTPADAENYVRSAIAFVNLLETERLPKTQF